MQLTCVQLTTRLPACGIKCVRARIEKLNPDFCCCLAHGTAARCGMWLPQRIALRNAVDCAP
jgi:hypothetical protein